MKVKEELKDQFTEAMVNLIYAIKSETENCGKLCGGVNEKELMVIVFVGKNKSVKMSEIAENIDAPMSTLTNIVDKLVEKNLLVRDHSGEDRRVIIVSLGSAGKTAYKNVSAKKRRVAEAVLSKVGEREQVLMIRLLHDLSDAMKTT